MPPCTRNGPTRVERHRWAEGAPRRALGRDPSALSRNSYSQFQTAQFLRSRGALLRPGFAFSLFHPPHEGRAERRKARISVVALFGARRAVPSEARRASSGTRSPLGAPPWRFWAGGRASFSGISSGSVQRAPRSQVIVPGGRGPGPPGAKRLRAAAAGRHSPLRLRLVSGDGPSDERGCVNTNTCAKSSQPFSVVLSRVRDVVTLS
jgi:hypothetical protein